MMSMVIVIMIVSLIITCSKLTSILRLSVSLHLIAIN